MLKKYYTKVKELAAIENINKELSDIFEKLFKFKKVSPNDCLQEDLMLNSIDLIELQVKIEDTFGMRFDPMDNDLPAIFKTVGSLDAFLKELKIYE